MSGFHSAFRSAMVDCEVYRNSIKIATHKGLINDTKDYNFISFDIGTDVQIGDDVYCPLKNKHYIINNTDIALFNGKPYRLDAYFDNNFNKLNSTNIFNTYNPTNAIIGNQQNAILNINDCYKNIQQEIKKLPEDKEELEKLLTLIKNETENNIFDKSKLSGFQNLILKHSSWLIPSIAQIIAAWIQRG